MTQQVRGVVARSKGAPVSLETIIVPDPGPGEALVKIEACGVCHTDLHYREGGISDDFPFLLGHEAAGVVEAVGDGVTDVAPGDFVILNWRAVCGSCRACLRGRPWYCFNTHNAKQKMTLADGTELSPALGIGAFAEKTLVAAGQCTKVDPAVSPAVAGLLGCGVMAGIGAAINTGNVGRGDTVAVIGCGGVGLQVVAGARLAGADPIVAVDRVPEKLELARAQGATHVVDVAAETDPAEAVRALTDGGVDHAFEVIGRPETIRLAWDAARPGGAAIVVGLAPVGVEASVPAVDFLSDKSLLGTYYGSGDPAAELPELAGLVLSRALDLERVVTHTAPLEGVGEALDRLRRGEGARTVLLVDPDLAGRPASVKEDSA
jgi:S-(hydroxymethyl)mycothiol dehydrogenase